MSVPDSVSRKIYDITEKKGETVPNWIKGAAIKRVEEETNLRFCDNCKGLKPVKSFSNGMCKVCHDRREGRKKK